jgi:two-component system sensor kinase FixL
MENAIARNPRLMLVGLNALVAVAYIVASELAMGLMRYNEAAIVWFASGVGLAALLLRGPSVLPGIAIGALICALNGGKAPGLAVGVTLITTAQLALTWWLLVRVADFDAKLERVRDVLLLAVVGATVSPMVNAARILLATWWHDGAISPQVAGFTQVVSLGEVVGILLVVPAILTWMRPGKVQPERRTEQALLYFVTLLASLGVFSTLLQPMMRADTLPYALFPIAFWAAFRFGVRQTSLVLLISGITALTCHGAGTGPFVQRSIASFVALADVGSLYLFVATLSITALLIAVENGQREAAEEALRLGEEKYRLLVDNQTDLLMKLCGKTNRVLYASPSHEAFYGKPIGQFIGQPFDAAVQIHDEDRDAARNSWNTVCCAPHFASHEARVMTARGWRWLAWSARAVLDAEGKPDFVVTVGRDVTDRRRAEEQARQHLQQLAHVSRVSSMGEMASAIAHEINQPLTAISNYSSACTRLLREGKASQGEALETMQRVAAEAQRAGEIVRKMRGFVRGEEGQLAAVDVNFLVAEVLRLANPEARQNGVELAWASTAGLPPVLADSIQVQQVLLNLVRNAVESISSGDSRERRVSVTAHLCEDDGMVEITVRDTGPGIPAEDVEKVFEPFYTTKADGIGIGLALSRSIIDAHGGFLWTQRLAEGAEFRFTLPVAEQAATEVQRAA